MWCSGYFSVNRIAALSSSKARRERPAAGGDRWKTDYQAGHSRLARWVAIASIKTVPNGSPVWVVRERAADRRGRNNSSVDTRGRSWSSSFVRCPTATCAPWNTCPGGGVNTAFGFRRGFSVS